MKIRQPIITVVGHIDHGKTTILDAIRGTAIARKEAGAITQHVGASEIPLDVIKKICGPILERMNIKFTIPGLLMIDTPGHEAFTNLRKRGGSISDLAILVVDINEGFKAQTREAISILKQFKVPFIVAANKIDLLPGWKPQKTMYFSQSIKQQMEHVQQELDNQIYKLVISLSDYGIESERFDRIDDYTKRVAIVPVSGITKEGIAELLMLLTGLAQKYLEEKLMIEVSGPAKGSILEVKEIKGLGKTIDVILYDGILRKGDTIVIGGVEGPIVTKVRAILKPSPLKELREKGQFQSVDEVSAAAGIKISAPNLDNAIAGMSLRVANTKEEVEKAKEELAKEIKNILFEKGDEGVIIKADSVGAVEALEGMFKQISLPIRKAGIGSVTKNDVVEAKLMKEKNKLHGVIFAFNVEIPKDVKQLAEDYGIKIFSADIIYTLFEKYKEWKEQQIEEERRIAHEKLIWPGKVKILKGYIFRQSNPAVVGVEVFGRIKTKVRLIRKDGKEIGEIKEIQNEGQSVSEAKSGDKVAISIPKGVVGRNIHEGDELLAFIPRSHLEIIESKFMNDLTEEELKIIEEFKQSQKSKGL
ncbi:MAG: translation initiation factor IF-2 [Nanoarchaeota archaeon]|nr:translation initiation factor IF-2 [Nanoarchaeota archaeon]